MLSLRQLGEVALAERLHPARRSPPPRSRPASRACARGGSLGERPRDRDQHGHRRSRCRWRPARRARRPMSAIAAAKRAETSAPALTSGPAPGSVRRPPQPVRRGSATSGAGSCSRASISPAWSSQLRDRGMEDKPGVGGVVVGDQDDRALGVLGADRSHDVGGLPLGEHLPQAAPARAACRRPRRTLRRPRARPRVSRCPRNAARPRQCPGGARQAQRPPVRAVQRARSRPRRRRPPR